MVVEHDTVRMLVGSRDHLLDVDRAIRIVHCSYFTDTAYHAYSKQARYGDMRSPLIDIEITPSQELGYTKPIVILTSATTVSAAEIFSWEGA